LRAADGIKYSQYSQCLQFGLNLFCCDRATMVITLNIAIYHSGSKPLTGQSASRAIKGHLMTVIACHWGHLAD